MCLRLQGKKTAWKTQEIRRMCTQEDGYAGLKSAAHTHSTGRSGLSLTKKLQDLVTLAAEK